MSDSLILSDIPITPHCLTKSYIMKNMMPKITSVITSKSTKVQLTGIYLIFFFISIIFMWGTEITFCNDSLGYVEAGRVFINGSIDAIRTPLYPLFCYLFESIFPSSIAYLVLNWAQYILFLLSIYALYRIGKYFIKSPLLLFFSVLVYSCHPATLGWFRCIQTESLAISLIVFLAYSILLLIQKESYKNMSFTSLILFLLIALKPSFAYLLPMLFVLWCYMIFIKKKKKMVYVTGIGFILGIIILILGYCYAYQQKYEVFQPSYVTSINQYYILREANLINGDHAKDNTELQKDMEEFLKVKDLQEGDVFYKEFFYLLDHYGIATTHRFINTAFHENSKEYAQAILQHFPTAKSQPSFITYTQPLNLGTRIVYKCMYFLFNPAFHFLFLFLGIYFVCLLYYCFVKKTLPLYSILLWTFIVANITTALVGALGEWNRLITPSIPFICLLIGQCLDQIKMVPFKEIELK